MPQAIVLPAPAVEAVTLDGLSGRNALGSLQKGYSDPAGLNTRGRKEADLYRAVSPSVVLMVTDEGLGSGSYLGSGRILTNWHVVGSARHVGVVFKPEKEGEEPSHGSIVKGEVLRIDPAHDLALVKLSTPAPPYVRDLALGAESDIEVGADVYAIGHPVGQVWTYTRGLISQFYRDYPWKYDHPASSHHADVILTQTPISPGNSGGPLISESGKLLGVNSFGGKANGLYFAVAVEEVLKFLDSSDPKARSDAGPEQPCKPTQLYSGRNQQNDGVVAIFASRCDGFADFTFYMPDDTKRPVQAFVDSNHDRKVDVLVEDRERKGQWYVSFHDVDFDGKIDMVGFHPDGKLTPSRFEKYDPSRTY